MLAAARNTPPRLLTRSHWLDARFPRVSAWVVEKAREAWLAGLKERAR